MRINEHREKIGLFLKSKEFENLDIFDIENLGKILQAVQLLEGFKMHSAKYDLCSKILDIFFAKQNIKAETDYMYLSAFMSHCAFNGETYVLGVINDRIYKFMLNKFGENNYYVRESMNDLANALRVNFKYDAAIKLHLALLHNVNLKEKSENTRLLKFVFDLSETYLASGNAKKL